MKRFFKNRFWLILLLAFSGCFGGSETTTSGTTTPSGGTSTISPIQGAIAFCSSSAAVLTGIENEIVFSQYTSPTKSEIFMMLSDGSGKTQITNHGVLTMRPRKTPDNRIIGISNMDGDFDVYIWEFSGDLPCRITNNTSLDGSPSMNGSNQVFYNGILQSINAINRDGSNPTLLIGNTAVMNGSPAACGSKVAYISNATGKNQVYTMNDDGTNRTQITFESSGISGGLNCCPDGSKIVYTSAAGYVKTVESGAGARVQITAGKEGTFNPTCDEIAFVRSGEIYKTTLAGVVTQLTNDGKEKSFPSW